jgi:hypothetical protein
MAGRAGTRSSSLSSSCRSCVRGASWTCRLACGGARGWEEEAGGVVVAPKPDALLSAIEACGAEIRVDLSAADGEAAGRGRQAPGTRGAVLVEKLMDKAKEVPDEMILGMSAARMPPVTLLELNSGEIREGLGAAFFQHLETRRSRRQIKPRRDSGAVQVHVPCLRHLLRGVCEVVEALSRMELLSGHLPRVLLAQCWSAEPARAPRSTERPPACACARSCSTTRCTSSSRT